MIQILGRNVNDVLFNVACNNRPRWRGDWLALLSSVSRSGTTSWNSLTAWSAVVSFVVIQLSRTTHAALLFLFANALKQCKWRLPYMRRNVNCFTLFRLIRGTGRLKGVFIPLTHLTSPRLTSVSPELSALCLIAATANWVPIPSQRTTQFVPPHIALSSDDRR